MSVELLIVGVYECDPCAADQSTRLVFNPVKVLYIAAHVTKTAAELFLLCPSPVVPEVVKNPDSSLFKHSSSLLLLQTGHRSTSSKTLWLLMKSASGRFTHVHSTS